MLKRLALPLGLLAWLAFWCVAAATLAGCDNGGSSNAGTSQGKRIYDVTESSWYARNDLPPIDDEIDDCERLPLLELLAPGNAAEYRRFCPANSWACLRWLPLAGRARSLEYPLAIMSPRLSADRWPAHGIHELLHAVMECAGLGVDYFHVDKRVWRPAVGCVEDVAVRAIYEPIDEDDGVALQGLWLAQPVRCGLMLGGPPSPAH